MKNFKEWLNEVQDVGVTAPNLKIGQQPTATGTTTAPKITVTTTTANPKKVQQDIVKALNTDLQNPQGKDTNLLRLMVSKQGDIKDLIKNLVTNKIIKV